MGKVQTFYPAIPVAPDVAFRVAVVAEREAIPE
jgi:hypothetical protein